MSAIYDTHEYKLSSDDMKGWAFTHRDNYITGPEAARRMGVKMDGREATVITNLGNTVKVPIKFNTWTVEPTGLHRVIQHSNGKAETLYMLKGKNPKGARSEYFSAADLHNSEEFKRFNQEIEQARQEFVQQHKKMLRAELNKKLPPVARAAAAELQPLANGTQPATAILKWFASHGFDVKSIKHPDEFFAGLIAQLKAGNMTRSWQLTSGPDGYGHQTGTQAVIDFENKKFSSYGWSSDD